MPPVLLRRSRKNLCPITAVTPDSLAACLSELDGADQEWVEATNFTASPGSLCLLPSQNRKLGRVLFGQSEEPLWGYAALPGKLPPGAYRLDGERSEKDAQAAALGWLLGTYGFGKYKPVRKTFPSLLCPSGADADLAEQMAEAIFLVRDLINTPAGDMGPAELAAAARRLGRQHKAKVRVIKGADLLRKNYPAIHAVGRASAQEPRLIDLRWGKNGPKITLVGKGVCFDTGGLDLKPSSGMKLMKKDMGGSAHVLGLASVIMASGLAVRLRVLVPAVENSVSGNAYRPLDVLQTRKGITIEVGNTDAEGRIILSDALAEAVTEEPDLLLDFATLTGAARVALGTELPALFSNNDDMAERMLSYGLAEGDPLWRLPLHRPYRRLLNSKVAHMNNISPGGFGGAITAALFLEEFVENDIPWMHIDLMAWNQSSRPGRPEGGEAMGLRAAYALIADLAKATKSR
ncbi:MAG: leucyl aminopeptidase family protein [Pseudomonadota bacterium]